MSRSVDDKQSRNSDFSAAKRFQKGAAYFFQRFCGEETSTNVLSDPSYLTSLNRSPSDLVEKGGLTRVNVAEDDYYWLSNLESFLCHIFLHSSQCPRPDDPSNERQFGAIHTHGKT